MMISSIMVLRDGDDNDRVGREVERVFIGSKRLFRCDEAAIEACRSNATHSDPPCNDLTT
jgi:hypothetical protein